MSLPEPWLRGTITDTHPVTAQLLYSFQQTVEDLERWTEGLTNEQMWARPAGLAPIGFHVRHIAGSVDRLLTYARGEQLNEAQLAELKSEMDVSSTREELLSEFGKRLESAGAIARAFDPSRFEEARGVGRKQLPTTMVALIIHTAEHTQRHLGQAITTAKLVRAGLPG